MTTDQLHTCSYSCRKPMCIEAQRNELFSYTMDIYKAVQDADPKHRMTFKQVMEYAANRLKETT